MGCSSSFNQKEYKSLNRSLSRLSLTPGMFLSKNRGEFSEKYTELQKIGSGAYSEVKLCEYKATSQKRAVKIIRKAGLDEQQMDPEYMLKEITVLTSLDHPNILRCYEIFEDHLRFYVSIEYCEGGHLFKKIVQMKTFNESQAAEIMSQLLSAVAYCHERLVIHRDLKPENILLEEVNGSLSIKVADFGSSCFIDTGKNLTGCFGSAYYIAPEVLKGEYNEMCDEWSCGIIMYVLLTGRPPYAGKDPAAIIRRIQTSPIVISDMLVAGISTEAVSLLRALLNHNPSDRIKAADAMNHDWVRNYRKSVIGSDLTHTLKLLEEFNCTNRLKDAVHVYLATQVISKEECQILTHNFKCLDTNGDGKISKDELIYIYAETLSEKESKLRAQEILSKVDINYNGEIDYSEFLCACLDYYSYLSRSNLEAAFRVFDYNDDGFISLDEIRAVLGQGNNLSDEVWQNLLNEADSNGDGVIDMMEFVKLMMSED